MCVCVSRKRSWLTSIKREEKKAICISIAWLKHSIYTHILCSMTDCRSIPAHTRRQAASCSSHNVHLDSLSLVRSHLILSIYHCISTTTSSKLSRAYTTIVSMFKSVFVILFFSRSMNAWLCVLSCSSHSFIQSIDDVKVSSLPSQRKSKILLLLLRFHTRIPFITREKKSDLLTSRFDWAQTEKKKIFLHSA